ncbi:MAG: YceI family protein [Turneriella sp.]|nr:YceI family protein [Turneriella sp.]
MAKTTILITTTLALVFAACEKPPVAQKAEAQTVFPVAKAEGTEFKIDTEASVIKWIGTKVTGKHEGTVKLKSGSVFVKDGKIVAGKFVADMQTIDNTDLKGEYYQKLLKHLKSEDFFEVAKFPESVFEISSVEKTDAGYTIKGNLTMKGITHGITFNANIEWDKKTPKSATANFNFDRKKWGIVYPGKPDDLISDTVNLALDLKIKKG